MLALGMPGTQLYILDLNLLVLDSMIVYDLQSVGSLEIEFVAPIPEQ